MSVMMASKFERRLKRRDERVVNALQALQHATFEKPLYAGALLHSSPTVYLAAFAKG
jgi:hypothetical protein